MGPYLPLPRKQFLPRQSRIAAEVDANANAVGVGRQDKDVVYVV